MSLEQILSFLRQISCNVSGREKVFTLLYLELNDITCCSVLQSSYPYSQLKNHNIKEQYCDQWLNYLDVNTYWAYPKTGNYLSYELHINRNHSISQCLFYTWWNRYLKYTVSMVSMMIQVQTLVPRYSFNFL